MSQAIEQPPKPIIQEGDTLLSNRWKILIGLLILVTGLSYFGFIAFGSATVYYYTVTELNDIGPTPPDKLVRVKGKLDPSSFYRNKGSTVAHFTLSDDGGTLYATHDGVLPDLFFNEHSEIILEGEYQPNGIFDSQTVIVSCPSKYIAADESA